MKKMFLLGLSSLYFLFAGTATFAEEESQCSSQKVAYLGVATKKVSNEVRYQLGLDEGFYLSVENVGVGTPANEAGIRQFDILTQFDDQLLVNHDQLSALVKSKAIGDSVSITYLRKGKETKVDVFLGGIEKRKVSASCGKGFGFNGFPFPGKSDCSIGDLECHKKWNKGSSDEK